MVNPLENCQAGHGACVEDIFYHKQNEECHFNLIISKETADIVVKLQIFLI
jgi:hypothetical protein